MVEERRSRLLWYAAAILVVAVVGQQWHFGYERLGATPFLAWLFPTNESSFEHAKLAVFTMPLIVVAIRLIDRRRGVSLVCAYAASVLTAVVIQQGGFHLFYAILGGHNLVITITLFVLGQIAACLVAIQVAWRLDSWNWRRVVMVALAAIHVAGIIVSTYVPPHWPIYYDTEAEAYGLDAARYQLEHDHDEATTPIRDS